MKKDSSPRILKSKTPKVYKDKKLNNANFGDFNHSDYKLFLHLVSKIGGVDEYGKYLQPEEMQREHILTAKEFSEMFNTDIHNSYGILKQAVDKLMKTDIRIERSEGKGYCRINVCSKAEYNKKGGNIQIRFTDDIMPYLAQVKQRFVLYNLKEVSGFSSLYTTRLYELIQEFKETGWIRKSLEQLREIFAIGDKLKAYKDFKKYTFGHACTEINQNYNLGLSFKEFKEGRKIVAIEFSFKKTTTHQVTNAKTCVSRNVYTKPEKTIAPDNLIKNDFEPIDDIINKLF